MSFATVTVLPTIEADGDAAVVGAVEGHAELISILVVVGGGGGVVVVVSRLSSFLLSLSSFPLASAPSMLKVIESRTPSMGVFTVEFAVLVLALATVAVIGGVVVVAVVVVVVVVVVLA